MKKVQIIIALILHIIYYVFAILSLGDYNYAGYGVGKAFELWILAMIISFPVIALYLIDAIKLFLKERTIFSNIKLSVTAIAIPLCLIVGCTAGTVESIIWNTYFTGLFVFEIISYFSYKYSNHI